MTGMANAAAMSQMVQTDYNRMQLTHGAKTGALNKNEFTYLGNYMNETERLRGLYGKDGLSPSESAILARRQQSYDKMYQKYSYGDYHPRTTARDGIQQRQINQLGNIYDGARSGQMTGRETLGALREQNGISHQKGVYQRGGFFTRGHLNGGERSALHGRLNQSGANINNMRNNWSNDWTQLFFGW